MLVEPQLGTEEYGLIKQVLDSNYLNEAELTERFEQESAGRPNVRHACDNLWTFFRSRHSSAGRLILWLQLLKLARQLA